MKTLLYLFFGTVFHSGKRLVWEILLIIIRVRNKFIYEWQLSCFEKFFVGVNSDNFIRSFCDEREIKLPKIVLKQCVTIFVNWKHAFVFKSLSRASIIIVLLK